MMIIPERGSVVVLLPFLVVAVSAAPGGPWRWGPAKLPLADIVKRRGRRIEERSSPSPPPPRDRHRHRHRHLQDDAPSLSEATTDNGASCAFFPEDGIFEMFDIGQLLRPSVFEACLSSLVVDTDSMLRHIQGLDSTFRQSYAFYNVAKDPLASDPASYQPELGNTVYQSENEGRVDLNGRMTALADAVRSDGATVSAFWEIADIFSDLKDAHVSLPPLPAGSVAMWYIMFVVPERCIGFDLEESSFTVAQTHFSYDERSGELAMTVIWSLVTVLTPDASEITIVPAGESVVKTINGMTPLEYLTSIANAPIESLGYKSIGSRINALLTFGWVQNPEVNGFPFLNSFAHLFVSSSAPSKILPDTFVVTYMDGEEEVYHTGIFQTEAFDLFSLDMNTGQVVMDVESASAGVNKAGRSYLNYERALGRIGGPPEPAEDVSRGIDLVETVENSTVMNPDGTRGRELLENFDYFFFDMTGMDIAGGYVLLGDYAVFKISSFVVLPDDIVAAWMEMTTAAKNNGITKVVIDISSNGGGVAVSGEALTVALFPTMEYKWFEERFDVVYNEPMRLWVNEVADTVEELVNQVIDLAVNDTETLLGIFENYSTEILDQAQNIADTMKLFCLENCQNAMVCTRLGIDRCDVLERLSLEMEEFAADRNIVEFEGIFLTLIETMASFNPWTIVDFLALFPFEDRLVVRTVNRGGVETNLTRAVNIMTVELFNNITSDVLSIGHSFDEYILLSNGAAGSTTQIFQATVTQLWRNRDRASGIRTKVTSVSYGGTNVLEDMSLAGFPAVVDTVYKQDPIIAAAALFMAYTLLPSGTDIRESMGNIGLKYFDSLASPAFFAESFPMISVVNFYDSFMNPGALPLEYVEIHPDGHVPQIYTSVSMMDPSQLEELYAKASDFFNGGGVVSDGGGIAAPTPAAAPTTQVPAGSPAQEEGIDSGIGVIEIPPLGNGTTAEQTADSSASSWFPCTLSGWRTRDCFGVALSFAMLLFLG